MILIGITDVFIENVELAKAQKKAYYEISESAEDIAKEVDAVSETEVSTLAF